MLLREHQLQLAVLLFFACLVSSMNVEHSMNKASTLPCARTGARISSLHGRVAETTTKVN
jgi:hypothetical protein